MRPISTRHLLTGVMLGIWSAALSGFALEESPAALLALHLLAGCGGIVPLTAFLARHWWRRRRRIEGHANARLGYVALTCLVVLGLSGLALLRWTNYRPLGWLHSGAALGLMLDLSAHVAWRLWSRHHTAGRQRQILGVIAGAWPRIRRRPGPVSRWLAAAVAVAGFVLGLAWLGGASQRPAQAQAEAIPLAHASLQNRTLPRAGECGACHESLGAQWQISAHANAASNPYYLALTGMFIQERGVEAARFCATCHNPIGLMGGEVDPGAAASIEGGQASGDGVAAYQARALNISLPISARAAEGVTCAMCHQVADGAEEPRNGSLRIEADLATLPRDPVAQLVLRVAPAGHRAALQHEVVEQAQLCGGCHNLYSADGLALEPTYDEWLDSPYAARGVTCQSCHMPPVQARPVGSDLPRPVRSHGGPPGAPSSLPGLADGDGLLRQAATLDVNWEHPQPASLLATVVITNSGAGHHLPTGAADLRQMWLEVTLRDAAGALLWQSGGLDAFGALDPGAVQLHKVLGDGGGKPIELHRIWVARQVLSDTSLAPLERREIPYHVRLPVSAPGPYTLTARLLYRDVSQAFAEFALDRAVKDLPRWEMAKVQVVVGD